MFPRPGRPGQFVPYIREWKPNDATLHKLSARVPSQRRTHPPGYFETAISLPLVGTPNSKHPAHIRQHAAAHRCRCVRMLANASEGTRALLTEMDVPRVAAGSGRSEAHGLVRQG